jgi:hypothetical protein
LAATKQQNWFSATIFDRFSQWQKTTEQQQQAAVSSSAAWANYVRTSNKFFPRVVVHPSLTYIAFDSRLGWVLHISADFLFPHFRRFFVSTFLPLLLSTFLPNLVSCFRAVVSEMVDYIISNIS